LETKKKEIGGLELIEEVTYHQEVEVTSATWSSDSQAVSGLETNARRGSHSDPLVANVAARSENDCEIVARFSSGDICSYDFVWLATGGLDMNLVPVLASLQAQRPIPTADGLPKLQTNLSWDVGTCQHHARTHTHTHSHTHTHTRTHTHTCT
jgi:hypothetical protein